MPTDFAHLHVHTENSMLDGLDAPEAYVARAATMGQKHLAITDHGNMCGVPSFYKACRDAGVNPILGEEFYFVPDAVASREEKDRERFHVTMMARNAKGFEVMCHLSTESHRRFYGKPLLDRALLEQLGDDAKYLTVLSGCAGSIISQKIMGEEPGEPAEELEWWTKIFPNFYLELMHHGTDFDRSLNKGLLRLGRKFGLPHVITNDPHFVMEDDCVNHDALLAIQTASDIDDPNRFRFHGSGYHLKSRKEMFQSFKEYEKTVWKTGVQHTLDVARSTDIRIPTWDKTSWHIPDFPDVEDSYAEVKRLCARTMRRRGLKDKPAYTKQLEHELAAIKKVPKMADFLLITRDIDEYMRRQGYMVGPGRGSVAGTLVGYLIGVHKVDPIRYELMFERFLNPDRPKMPDVDTDFAPNERPFAFQYVIEKYGVDNVAPVAAFQTMKTKRAFQSLAAAHGMDFKKRMVFSNQIEEDEEGNAILPEALIKGYPDLITQMEKLTGAKGALSSHPAGVLIFSPEDEIRKTVPYMWIPAGKSKEKGKFVAQYDLAATELLYLMKQDLLGLRNLATIAYTVQLVRERHGRSLNPDAWIPDEEPGDASVYKMIGSGDTDGVFQMEGKSNRAGIQRIGCKKFEDLVTCTSLFRAGPIIAGAPKRYIRNREDQRVRVIHPSLKDILAVSWGEMIYDEQMFRILNEAAGFSWARVDDAKTAMKKKNPEKMAAIKPDAIKGFMETSGMSAEQAEQTWEMIAAQASYLFNRSHAVAYSLVTYQTAKLKHDYPQEYLAACIATVPGANDADKEKRQRYMSSAAARGFEILPPCVNKSEAYARPEGKKGIRLGFVDIKGVGDSAARRLIEKRPAGGYTKKWQVVGATASNVRTALIQAGALDCLGIPADPGLQEELLLWQFYDPLADFRAKWGPRRKVPKGDGPCLLVGEIRKTEKKKAKNGNFYYRWQCRWEPGSDFAVTIWSDANELWDLQVGSIVAVEGKWSSEWGNTSVGDHEMVRVLHAVRPSTS